MIRLFTSDKKGHIIQVWQEDLPDFERADRDMNPLVFPILVQYYRGIESFSDILEKRDELEIELENARKLANNRYEDLQKYWRQDADRKIKKWWQFWKK